MNTKHFLLAAVLAALAFLGCYSDGGDDIVYGEDLIDSRDSQTYRTVVIGTQTRMAENLNYNAEGSICYGNDPANCEIYGRLYEWKTALTACPSGWHLPSDDEWATLIDYAGDFAGTKLKAYSGWGWQDGHNGTDKYGFAALPSGGNAGYWWTANDTAFSDSWFALGQTIYYHSSGVYRSSYQNEFQYKLSVRCVKNSGSEMPSSSSVAAIVKGTLADSRDGKAYKTVVIGAQTWMAENLDYEAAGSLCYDNDPANCAIYGRLYDWETALIACPDGWHLPSNEEWTTLTDFVDSDYSKLKAQSGWNNCGPARSGSYYVCEDTYGFLALPGGSYGYGNSDLPGESFAESGIRGTWWSITESNSYNAYYLSMKNNDGMFYGMFMYGADKSYLFSIRCIKDN